MLKEAILLSNHYKVSIINGTYSKALVDEDKWLIRDRDINIISLSSLEKKDLDPLIGRLVKKIGNFLVQRLGISSYLSLGYGAWKYESAALKQKADLYICHQEMGLYCGTKLLKHNKKVAFDLEDWYSEDLLPQARKHRPVKLLRQLESEALQKGSFNITTSHTMATMLAERYGAAIPEVIYNSFKPTTVKLAVLPLKFKMVWFSQTIGPGRGLEEFFELMKQVEPSVEIHLIGNVTNDYGSFLKQQIPKQHEIYFAPIVPSDKLTDEITRYDIGLALELNDPPSRNYTITNKLFQYIASGLPIVATETLGQLEILQKYPIGITINFNEPAMAAAKLNAMLGENDRWMLFKENIAKAAGELNWENDSKKLLKIVDKTLHNV